MSAPSAAASCGFSQVRRAPNLPRAQAGPSRSSRSRPRTGARTAMLDISPFRFVDDPVALAKEASIDVFVELIGGEGGVAKEAVEAALRAGKHVVTANKALLAQHGPALAALAEKNGVALNFEAAVAGGIPVVKAHAREPRRQRHPPRLRHPQRHLQLHPDADGARGQDLRRRAEGGAGARLCRGRSRPSTSAASTRRTSSRF